MGQTLSASSSRGSRQSSSSSKGKEKLREKSRANSLLKNPDKSSLGSGLSSLSSSTNNLSVGDAMSDKLSIKSDKANPISNKHVINVKNRESKSLSPLKTRKAERLVFPDYRIESRNMALKPKTNQIYDDYYISKQVLGLGISGKVLVCTSKRTQAKYALKVRNVFNCY